MNIKKQPKVVVTHGGLFRVCSLRSCEELFKWLPFIIIVYSHLTFLSVSKIYVHSRVPWSLNVSATAAARSPDVSSPLHGAGKYTSQFVKQLSLFPVEVACVRRLHFYGYVLPSHCWYVAFTGPPQHVIKTSALNRRHTAALWLWREMALTPCCFEPPHPHRPELAHSHLAATRRSFIYVFIQHYWKEITEWNTLIRYSNAPYPICSETHGKLNVIL